MQEPRLEPRAAAPSLTCLNHLPQGILFPQLGKEQPRAQVGCLHFYFFFFNTQKKMKEKTKL